jgi:hypothetical protein
MDSEQNFKKRSLWIEFPLVILASIYIVLNIAVLSHSFNESIDDFLILWIYCLFAAITVFILMIHFAVNALSRNMQRILFVLTVFFTDFGIVCEFYSNSNFFYL